MRRVRFGVGVCTLALAAAIAAHASAATPPGFYGVVSQGHLAADDFARMQAGNVGTVRVTLPWGDIDRTALPADDDWAAFDRLVAASARAGLIVFPTVYTVPAWVAALEACERPSGGPCSITPPRTDLGLAAWRAFLADATARYGPGGAFWAAHPELPPAPIRVWQIWNEQNSPGFFQPEPDVGVYAGLVRSAADAIRGVDPGAEIVLGGMFRNPLGGRNGGIRATEFLRNLYVYPGLDAAFDGVAIHPYAGRMSGVKRQVKRTVRVVRQAGDAQASFWISEVGWASGGKRTPLNRGPDGQATRLAQSFRYFTRERARLRLRAILWYAWRDVPEAESRCKWCARSGLFRSASLVPKPAWAQFTRFTGGR